MSTIRQRAEEYLAMRRGLGFKLTTFGQRLLSFVTYLEHHDADVLTVDLAVAWATSTPRSTSEVHWSRRLMVVRCFARHLAVLDPATQVPAMDILSRHYCRVSPHLYSPAEIDALLEATDTLRPALRALTWRTLLGLLAVTGMRPGEACRLDRQDVDLAEGVLTIWDSKFAHSRQVPIRPDSVTALRRYARARDQIPITAGTTAFLVSTRGTRLDQHNLSKTFRTLTQAAGITTRSGQRPARLIDLRHTFAVATMLDWYRDGADVAARLPRLSTYLGHTDPKSTYWYLTGSPELLALVAARLEHAFTTSRR
jgi:site-specific recombinase XerD